MYGCESESESELAQLCLTLCNSMDCSLSGSSVHWIFQERVLEWGAISFSRGSSQPRDRTWVSCIAGRHFTVWATREASACVCMWELDYKESWVPKYRCFWTVVLEKTLLRVPRTARRSNQSILKEISPEYSLEGLMLKLKLQYFGHLMRRTDSFEKTLMLG